MKDKKQAMSDTPLTDAILNDEGKCNTYYAYVALCRSLERENAALKEETYKPVATLLPSDPYDTRRLCVSRYSRNNLAKLPAGTVLYIRETKT